MHSGENQLHHCELQLGQHPEGVDYGGLQDKEFLGEHFGQRTGPEGWPYVHSPLDLHVRVIFLFIVLSVLPSSSSAR